MTNFVISVTSDTVCPWCFVGKRKLEAGIALYKKAHPGTTDTFTTIWLPYQLNPNAPTPGVNKREYFIQRFGEQRMSMMFRRLEEVGKAVGIDFKFGGKTGNTRDSHRLIALARSKGADMQNKLAEELFSTYFEKEGDLTDHDTLRAAAVRVGMDEVEVKKWLESDKGGAEVDREVVEAQIRGVTGVPNFVLQNKYEIGGAQDPDDFVRVIERVKELKES
ncbi:MAG: hypothetical protein Q9217_005740 [Psora testacea]